MCVEFCFILREKSEHISLPSSSSLFASSASSLLMTKTSEFFSVCYSVSLSLRYLWLYGLHFDISHAERELSFFILIIIRVLDMSKSDKMSRAHAESFSLPEKPLSNRHPTIQVESEQSSLSSHHCLTLLIRKIN